MLNFFILKISSKNGVTLGDNYHEISYDNYFLGKLMTIYDMYQDNNNNKYHGFT